MSLVDPAIVATLKARAASPERPAPPAVPAARTVRPWSSPSDLGRAVRLVVETMNERFDPDSLGANILEHGFRALLEAAYLFQQTGRRADVLSAYDRHRVHAEENYERTVLGELGERLPAAVVRETEKIRDELDMAAATADAAREEARAARAEADALRADLERLRAEHADDTERHRVAYADLERKRREDLAREREQFAARERALNEERRVLRADLQRERAAVRSLTNELDALTAPTPEVPVHGSPIPNPFPSSPLERMSLFVFRARRPDLADVDALAAWRAEVRDHAGHCRAHLRERGHLPLRSAA